MESTNPNTQDVSEAKLDEPCWCLTIVHHPERALLGKRLIVASGRTQLGRGSTCFGVAGVFESSRISREHAVLELEGEQLELHDQGSRNGTLVNGAQIKQATLACGDVVTIGKMLLVVGLAPALYPDYEAGGLVGASHAYSVVRAKMAKVAEHDTTVLFSGPPGSGKDALAAQLHDESGRSGKMVTLVCGAIDEVALHSELFGHKKGAYAGATRDRRGLIETADKGTLLLAAVADASPKLQISLLRFLETGSIRRLGADQATDVDVRVVAMTSEPLDALVADGKLRRDFADRLRKWEIRVPALSERLEDIGLLADMFVQRFGGPDARLHIDLVVHIQRRAWAGNARELEAQIELAVIESDDGDESDSGSVGHAINLVHPEGPARPAGPSNALAYAVATTGEWFRTPEGERIDIRDRKNLVRILHALTEERQRSPGSTLTVPELLAIGWPDEHVEARSGANRVYVALTTLRRLGMRDLITRDRDGYLIPADAPIEIAPA